MGRPRVVRSPEEQAAFNERRRELTRERAHRRRTDPAVRAAGMHTRKETIHTRDGEVVHKGRKRKGKVVHKGRSGARSTNFACLHFPGGEGLDIF